MNAQIESFDANVGLYSGRTVENRGLELKNSKKKNWIPYLKK